jgi:hypothetical protein
MLMDGMKIIQAWQDFKESNAQTKEEKAMFDAHSVEYAMKILVWAQSIDATDFLRENKEKLYGIIFGYQTTFRKKIKIFIFLLSKKLFSKYFMG